MPTLANIQAALSTRFEDKMYRLMNRAATGAVLLDVEDGQGQNIQWDVISGTTTGAPIADGGSAPSAQTDTFSPATLQWAIYNDVFSVTGLALRGAMAAGNPAQLADLYMEQMAQSIHRVCDKLGTDLYTGDNGASPRELSGLVHATNGALKASGTYATINKASITQFQGNELANGGVLRPVTMSLMRTFLRTIYTASGGQPDFFLCSPAQFERLEALYDGERRYVQDVTIQGRKISLDGAASALEWLGRPIIRDRKLADDKILAIEASVAKWKSLGAPPADITGMKGVMSLTPQEEYQTAGRSLPLQVWINPLSRDGDNHKFQLLVYCNVAVKQPNMCGMLSDLQS